MEKEKILFTGSLGFLFSNFIRKAAYEKYPYTFCGVDKAVNKKYLNNIYNNKIIEANYLADVSDYHIINNIFEIEKPNIVIHAASAQNNQEDYVNIKQCVDTNVLGTKILVDAAIKNKINKIIYFSDYQVYQPSLKDDSLIKENDSLNGDSLTSISQIAAENIITSSGLDYNILRICKIYGPRQINNEVVPAIIKSLKNSEQITLPYNELDTLDWMHTFDFSSALSLLLKEGKNKEIYNISSGQEFSIIEIIQFICNIMKGGHHLINCNNSKRQNRYALDNQKIIELGWKPMFKLKKGLEETVEWFLANQWALK